MRKELTEIDKTVRKIKRLLDFHRKQNEIDKTVRKIKRLLDFHRKQNENEAENE